MKNHIYTGMVVILLILFCGFAGCSSAGILPHHLVVKGNWEVSGLGVLKDPMPVQTHLDVVNTGDGDAKNVQIEVEFLYNEKVVKTEVVYFGTIKGGDSKVKDEVIFVPKPANFDGKLLDMQFAAYVDGERVSMKDL